MNFRGGDINFFGNSFTKFTLILQKINNKWKLK